MKRLIAATAPLVILAALAGTAKAGPTITSALNVISASGIGSGTLGSVTLTQFSASEVDVAVSLAADTDFVSTGGPHHAFVFNLDLSSSYTVGITTPTGGIFSLAGTNPDNTPYGTFSYGIDCPGCGPGASNANPGPLDFKVTDASGISTTDFVTNSGGYYFSADVIGPGGSTGDVASNAKTQVGAVPEPAALSLLATSLCLLGIARRRWT